MTPNCTLTVQVQRRVDVSEICLEGNVGRVACAMIGTLIASNTVLECLDLSRTGVGLAIAAEAEGGSASKYFSHREAASGLIPPKRAARAISAQARRRELSPPLGLHRCTRQQPRAR